MAPLQGSAAAANQATVCIVEADELLDVIDATDCRVLIAELKLPGNSGLELLAEMNARGRLVPTILLSEDSDVGTAVNAMRAGAADFIEKPVIGRILLRRVKDAIDRSPSR